jgi:hypothetical protein
MSKLIPIVYVGKKPAAFDNVARSGKCWNGNGDVQEVTDAQAKLLIKFPDQWALADEADAAAVNTLESVQVTDDEGNAVDIAHASLTKPLESMSKPELVAFAQAKFGQELNATKPKKLLIDAIEEFERDLEPVANVG